MTVMIAPPPVATVVQMADLVALYKNIDQVAPLVQQLKDATIEHQDALNALATANSDITNRAAALAEQEAQLAAAQATLAEKQAELDAMALAQIESRGQLENGFVNLQSRVDEFEANALQRTNDLVARESKVAEREATITADQTTAAEIKEKLAAKMAAVLAAAEA